MEENIHTFVILAYKKSEFLEECIKSTLNQKYKSKVIIATSTDNDYIRSLAKKYSLKIVVNNNSNGIGADFDFALSCGKTKLVTIAHQDDIYDFDYSYEMVKNYENNKNSIILFSNYYEIKGNKIEKNNINLIIKKIILFPLKIHALSGYKFMKRNSLRFGNAICCPSVTFVKKSVDKKLFSSELDCNVDWYAWEKLSNRNGKFCYISKYLMGHRIYLESTTSKIIALNARTVEDYKIFLKFWPKPIAKIISKIYVLSEKNNKC